MSTAYKPGDYVIVQFGGSKGRQLAKVARVLDGGYKVWKFRAVSKRWTKLTTVPASKIVGSAASVGPDLLRTAKVTATGLAR